MQPPPLKPFLRENRAFFAAFLLFLVVGGVLLLTITQSDAIFFFSDHRTPWLNRFFRFFTRLGEEIPFFLAILGLLFVRVRYALTVPLLGFTVGLVSFGVKSFFAHPRPYAYIEGLNQLERLCVVEGVEVHTGNTSFPSGHTMAAFALYAFLAFVLPRKGGWGLVLFTIALLVGVSRIYLVQHFLQDIYLGAILGVLLAVFFYFASQRGGAAYLDRSLWRAR